MRVQLCGEVCSNDTAELYRWFGLSVCCPGDLRTAIQNCPEDEELVLEINSGGGSVYAGFEMYSILRGYKGRVVAEIQSIAASAMSVITSACGTVRISPVAEMMIHRASAIADGTSQDMKQAAQMLDTIDESILTAYTEKTGGKSDRDKLARMMRKETFLTAQQAIDCGLADELLEAADNGGGEPDGGQSLLDWIPGLAVARATQAGADKPDLIRLVHVRQIPPVEDLIRLKAEREGKPPMLLFPTADAANAASADFSAALQGTDIQNKPKGEVTDNMQEIKDGNAVIAHTAVMPTTPDELAEMYPDLVGRITASAADEAAKAERERIRQIDEAAVPGYENLITAAKADPHKTAGDVALEIIKAQKDSGKAYLANRDADAKASNVNDVSAAVAPDTGGEDTVDEMEAAAKEAVALWKEGGAS